MLIDQHFRECRFCQVKLYHSSPKILIDPHFRKYWSIRIFILKIRIDPHFNQNTDRSAFSIINIFIDQYFHAGTFSASLGIQSVPSSRQVPALTRNPQGRQPSTECYSWWRLRLNHTSGATYSGVHAVQMSWMSLHEGPIDHVLSIQAPQPDPLNPDPMNLLLIKRKCPAKFQQSEIETLL